MPPCRYTNRARGRPPHRRPQSFDRAHSLKAKPRGYSNPPETYRVTISKIMGAIINADLGTVASAPSSVPHARTHEAPSVLPSPTVPGSAAPAHDFRTEPDARNNLAPKVAKLQGLCDSTHGYELGPRRRRGLRVEASTARLILLAVAAASSGSCKPITATKTTDVPQRGHRHGRPHLRPRHHPPSAASETCAPPPNSPCARTLRTGLRPCLLARASRR